MKPENDYLEQFDKYQQNDLSQEDMLTFQARLKADQNFKEEFEAYQESVLILQSQGIKEEMKEIMSSSNPPRNKKWVAISVAASITIILACYYILNSGSTSNDPKLLFQAYYKPYPDLAVVRSSGNERTPPGESVSDSSETKKVVASTYKGDTLLFYQAISYLNKKQSDSAQNVLVKIPANSIFRQQVVWYRALALLHVGKTDESVGLLKKIKSNEYKYKQASELLEKLSK